MPLPNDVEPLTTSSPPDWFRSVVWSGLAGGLCPLMPIPVLDDIVLARFRRRMVRRLGEKHGVELNRRQVAALGGGGRSSSCLGLIFKVVAYPFRKVLRKVLYFLSVKEAADTFSLLFHQGYLLHTALEHGALGSGGPPPAGAAMTVRRAIFETLDAIDTRPIMKLVKGVFRGSRDLLRGVIRWARRRLPTRAGGLQLDDAGQDPAVLAEASPEAEALLERLLELLWGEEGYRDRLREELVGRLDGLQSGQEPLA